MGIINKMTKVLLLCLFLILILLGIQAQDDCPTNGQKVVCYYASWAIYRKGAGSMNVSHIDPMLCTHVVYSFAGLDIIENRIVSLDPPNDIQDNGPRSYKKFIELKEKKPCLKTVLAVGGWNEKSRKYSVMANTAETRKEFAQSVLRFLTQYEFDGIDVDWEYPASRGGIPQDKANFVSFLKELKSQLSPWNLGISIAVGVMEDVVLAGYDIQEIANNVDFISLMAYDYTSSLSKTTGLLAPLDSDNVNDITIKKSVALWTKHAPKDKLILGIPFYARSFKLKDPNNFEIGAETVPNDMEGRFTKEKGFLSQYELAEMLEKYEYTIVTNGKAQNNYAHNGTYWVAFDDEKTITEKMKFVKNEGLGGIMIWSIDTDDFNAIFSKQKFPLLNAVNNELGKGRK